MQVKTLILGAGAAGLMAAAHCGPDTLIVDHAKAPGEKIRISGGGRCNFTNLHVEPDFFLSENKHFHKSALARYTQWDFIDLVQKHKIAYHEKTLGQLFCDTSAKDIIAMLLHEIRPATLWLQTYISAIGHDGEQFTTRLSKDGKAIDVKAKNLIVATGGKSIPKMGATGLAYDIAQQFGHRVTQTRPALVPFTFSDQRFATLAGVSATVCATADSARFEEAMLFTHRGLSGPAMLQVSSFWREGQPISIDLLPRQNLHEILSSARQTHGRQQLTTELSRHLPERMITFLGKTLDLQGTLADLTNARIAALCAAFQNWQLVPQGTEGYRTAEVTLGGIDTDDLDGKTMMSRHVPGLFFVGEAVDVTGWLGGYNFQWAWSSGFVAGQTANRRG